MKTAAEYLPARSPTGIHVAKQRWSAQKAQFCLMKYLVSVLLVDFYLLKTVLKQQPQTLITQSGETQLQAINSVSS